MDIFSSLNSEQQRAVRGTGPIIIIAGPGTGKTQTLTARIRYLLSGKKIDPSEILALTFTKKAAAEMRIRLKDLAHLPLISTFHGFAFDVLSRREKIILISDSQREEVVYDCVKEINGREPTNRELKESLLFIANNKTTNHQKRNHLVERYQQILKKRGLWDYEDLLVSLQEQMLSGTAKHFSHILVDEFQDTNELQYELIKNILSTDNLFVIGDPYQSIYGFRGAAPDIFQTMQKDFPASMTITFHENYRSGQKIIDAAESLFLKKRTLESIVPYKGELFSIVAVNEYAEAECILNKISELVGGTDLLQSAQFNGTGRNTHQFSQIAIIYRTHSIKNVVEKKLRDSGMPYQVIGTGTPFEAPEVAFVIDILQYLHKPSAIRTLSLLRSPILGLSVKTQRAFRGSISDTSFSINVMIENIRGGSDVALHDMNIVYTVNDFLINLSQKLKDVNFSQVIHLILTNSYLQEYVMKTSEKQGNINEFLSATHQFESFEEGIAYLTYLDEHEFYDSNAEKLTLMTIHASKGLEFETVIICGFEEGSIPLTREGIDPEEEARLLYVALTRAKRNVCLTSAQVRNRKSTADSSFKKALQTYLTESKEKANETYKKKIDKWKEKKAQMKIF